MSSSSSTGRSWMYERASRNGTGMNPLYMEGVTAFIQFARDNLMESDVIRCPCTRCTLNTYHTHYEVEFHLLKFGFMGGYHVWYGHGEVEGSVGHPALEEHLDGFANVVFDAAGPSFHATAEHSQMDEAPNAEALRFYNLLHDAKQPLYPGCEQSRLEAVAKFLTIKSEGYISDATFNRMLKQVRSILPEDATLTENYYKTKKMVKKLGLAYVKVHSCRNHCMLYYGEYADLNCCHICNEPRYKPGKEPGRRQKGVPNKQMRYFPITPRLQRLYMSTKTAEHMTWHMRNRSNEGEMVHPSDGDSWKHFDSMYPQFSEEPRNVRLGLATDGFDPFGSNSTPYSCWPVFLTPYNLPPWMCMKQQYLYLTMIIPGHPGKNLDVYLKPLVDELKNLWENGVVTYDASNKQNFTMRAAVMWTIGDFPAYGMLSSWSTHGPRSCPHCMGNSKAFMLRHGKKPCYFDCHRRFLPPSHPFRRNRNNFTRGRVEKDLPPRTVTGHELFAMVSRLPDIIPGQDVNSQKIRGFGADHNWTKRSIFWELPYWHSHLLRYMIDMMHTEKNNFDNLFNTVMDVQGKSKDNLKARLDLAEICHRPELELIENNGRIMKPNASYVVSKENQKLFYAWIRGLRLPDGYASNISRCCAKKDKFVGLKTHDCHVLMERLLPLGLRGMLPNALWEAITELSNFFRDMCSTVLRRDHLEKLEESIVVTVCKLEKIFPPAFFDSMEHLVVHLPYEAKCGGPVQYRWMYPFERCMHHLKQKVRNKASVEGSIAEAYLIEEISTFCSFYFDSNVETRINRPQRNDEGGNFNCDDCLSIFKHPGRGFGGKRERYLSDSELNAAQIYVLLNCEEIGPYIEFFNDEVRRQCQQITDDDLNRYREKNFSQWLRNYALKEDTIVGDNRIKVIASGPSNRVRCYNGYLVNGFRFHTEEYGRRKKAMNSGVRVNGSCYDDYERDFYGMLIDIVELSYMNGLCTTLFQCRWYDSENHLRVNKYGIIDINYKWRLASDEPFILASQANQVYYAPYPIQTRELNDWWAILNIKARSTYNVAETEDLSDNDAITVNDLYQEDEMGQCHVIEENEDNEETYSMHHMGESVVLGVGDEEEEEEEDEVEVEDEDEDEEEEEDEDEDEDEEEKEDEDDEDEDEDEDDE